MKDTNDLTNTRFTSPRGRTRNLVSLLITGSILLLPASATAQDTDLAGHFGFDDLEVIKIGSNAGPLLSADINADGLVDLVAVNNSKSRLELHMQKRNATETDTLTPPSRANELPEHWRFRRENVSVSDKVTGLATYDFDGDGLVDIVYSGPSTLVFLQQVEPGVFKSVRRETVKGIMGSRDGLAVADVRGDQRPELLALVDGDIRIWNLDGFSTSGGTDLDAGKEKMLAMLIEDYDGDQLLDIIGIVPENDAPVRLWKGLRDGDSVAIGPQHRFELPALREATITRLPERDGALLAIIERASKRLAFMELQEIMIEDGEQAEVSLETWSYPDSLTRNPDVLVVDIDGNQLPDVLAINKQSNSIDLFTQEPDRGLMPPTQNPSFADLEELTAMDLDGDGRIEIYSLSEKEGVVGRSEYVDGQIQFPQAISISKGHVPVTFESIQSADGPMLAVIAKSGRKYVLDLVSSDGSVSTIDLGSLSRSPESILSIDADQDGRRDMLLLTPEKPMMMIHSTEDGGYEVIQGAEMGQYGLVSSAEGSNTTTFDVDGDGLEELLIADRNYIRALRYDPSQESGSSSGWQVVTQMNADTDDATLVSVTELGGELAATDRERGDIVIFSRDEDGHWSQDRTMQVRGFDFSGIRAGTFDGGDASNILALGDHAFAILSLDGNRQVLQEIASWRTEVPTRVQHELAGGDVNGDGYADVVSVDAGEQMCEIFTFSEAERLLYGTGFQVFESKMFTGGEPREFQPSQIIIADVTGDDASDIILLCHDRILLYPQSTEPGD